MCVHDGLSRHSAECFRSALLHAGYKISRSHAGAGSIKTDAPRSFLFDIVREHLKENPVRMDKIAERSPARELLAKPQMLDRFYENVAHD